MMNLNQIFTNQRTGNNPHTKASRTDFQRDFDRIIFSSAFRRLQNKTQVFPLPGSVFVHNRLTHSLEVSSVGRSLGSVIGEFIHDSFTGDLTEDSKNFYLHNLGNVIAAGCLCHDVGNPAFGHSGEDAISKVMPMQSGYWLSSSREKMREEFSLRLPPWQVLQNIPVKQLRGIRQSFTERNSGFSRMKKIFFLRLPKQPV